MARKLKYSPKKNQPGLFDMTGDLFAAMPDTANPAHDLQQLEEEVQETMADFVFNASTRQPQKAKSEPIDSLELDLSSLKTADNLLFISFGSGSSGNCSYIGSRTEGVLIDAGVDPETIAKAMEANGLSMDCVKGICLTHDHSDHVRFVYSLVRKRPHIGIYCTPKTLNGILRRHSISRRIKDYHKPIYKEFPFTAGGLTLTAFEVSHDGTDNSGYFISRGKHSFAIATDLGCITDRVDYYMRQARYIMIEANYDAMMLTTGRYPMHLKARIAAADGHLDNVVAAQFIHDIYSSKLTHIFLCHLSQDNNTPTIALGAVADALKQAGVPQTGDGSGSRSALAAPVQLAALPRFDPSPLYVLRIAGSDD